MNPTIQVPPFAAGIAPGPEAGQHVPARGHDRQNRRFRPCHRFQVILLSGSSKI